MLFIKGVLSLQIAYI